MIPEPNSDTVAVEGDKSVDEIVESGQGSGVRLRLALLYCILVFACSWSIWIISLIAEDVEWQFDLGSLHFDLTRKWAIAAVGGSSPAIVAFVLGLITRWRYFPDPYSQLRSRVQPKSLYLVAISAPILLTLLAEFAQKNLASDTFADLGLLSILTLAGIFLVNLPLAPLWEEPGWRGCLLPLLTPRFGLWGPALIIGLVWAIWHLPLYLLVQELPANVCLAACVEIVAMSVVMAALYRAAGNSLRLPILFHGSWNAMSRFSTHSGWFFSLRGAATLAVGIWLLAVFCWLWWSGPNSDTSANPPL